MSQGVEQGALREKPVKEALQKRKRAMQPLKDRLAHEGRAQTWLVHQLQNRGFRVTQQSWSNYANGHSRIAQPMLVAACIIATGDIAAADQLCTEILAALEDRTLLLQPVTTRRRKSRSTRGRRS